MNKKGICRVSFNGDFPDKCTILQNMIGLLTEEQELYADRYYKELERRTDSLGSGMFEADERYLKNSRNWSGKIRFPKK